MVRESWGILPFKTSLDTWKFLLYQGSNGIAPDFKKDGADQGNSFSPSEPFARA
jgi:hypothetical protein